MDNKIEKMIIASRFKLSPDTVNAMLDDAQQLDKYSWARKYEPVFMNNENLAVDWKKEGMDKFSKDKYERYQDAFGMDDKKNPFDKPKEWLQATWQTDFADIPREEFMSDIANMSKYWQDYKAEGDRKIGIEQRKREIEKDWSLPKKMLASDYSKQRYINEPEKSVFSDKGAWYNKGEDVSDLIYGGAGAVGDVLPGWGVLVGPAIRTARDVQHKVTDSPYQKEWTNVAQDAATDALFNMGTDFLPNLRRFTNMGKRGAKESSISTVMQLEDDINSVRKQLKDLSKAYDSKSNLALIKTIEDMPEGDLKNELLKYTVDYKNIDKAGIAKVAANWNSKLNAYDTAPFIDVAKNSVEGKSTYHGSGEIFNDPLFKRKLLEPKLTKGQTVAKNVVRGVETAAAKGGPAIKLVDTANGRGSEPTTSDSLLKEWYKQNYKRDWLLEKPFKPAKKEGDPKWEAYVELRKENNLEP